MEQQFLNQFRNESLNQLTSLRPEEVEIFHDEPIIENFTLILRLDDSTLAGVEHVMNGLKKFEPNQFYYPLENLHLTIIGGLPTNIDPKIIVAAVEKVLPNYSLKFQLKGAGSNKYCSSLSAYPVDFSLHDLRDELRSAIGSHGDNYSSILKSYEYVGWINFMRFFHQPNQSYFDKLYSERDSSLGEFKPKILQLYKNSSKVLDQVGATLIKEFY